MRFPEPDFSLKTDNREPQIEMARDISNFDIGGSLSPDERESRPDADARSMDKCCRCNYLHRLLSRRQHAINNHSVEARLISTGFNGYCVLRGNAEYEHSAGNSQRCSGAHQGSLSDDDYTSHGVYE